MGITSWYDVSCDNRECLNWVTGDSTRARAAQNGKTAGFKRTRDGWMCPEHRADVCGEHMFPGRDVWCAMKPGHEGKHWQEEFNG